MAESTKSFEERIESNVKTSAIAVPESLVALSPEERERLGKRATRKLDLLILHALVIMYVLNYLDRQSIASAKLANLVEDLGLTDVQYQTCISLLFVGYILMQVPSTIMVGKISRPATYICAAMALWGIISACTGAVNSFAGLVTCRFFLGFVEAVFFPGALHYLSTFYTRRQYALRTAILYSGAQLGNAFGGLLAIAILQADGLHGIQGWRWLFIIEGVATVGLALLFATYLPNSVETAKFLTPQEKDFLSYNFRLDQGQADHKDELSAWDAFSMAVTDPKTWILLCVLYAVYIDGAVIQFFPSVVQTLGFSRNITYVLTAPPYLVCCVAMIVNGWHSDKTRERYWHIVTPLCFTVIAHVIAVATTNTAGRYVAMMLMPGSIYASSVVILSWVAGSLTQPAAKRAAGISLINAIANTPNIWCSYLYDGAPRYLLAFLVNLGAAVAAIILATICRVYLARQNTILEAGYDDKKSAPTKEQQDVGFRYML
ncbi:retrograde regulation protein 2 [Cylindrobasidium torrendii FP15055 ss-10]|uniref:Retrograde regulation protein 2 n=1 Tax=Cylindrobasidium torrendii FP15055 ss-10 TaxID=1314674 RepID=A0A0D7BTM2_9AGAR|nr:retrograde regulation protein 2 [Cylindrobasidium torrendii FP15055 ss-10]